MIEVIAPGMHSTFQDRGRYGYRKYGVPISGAMDFYSAGLANMLVNNPPDNPVLEITIAGPVLRFMVPTEIAITGADMSPTVNGRPISRNKIIPLATGDQLTFGKLIAGSRCYLAVRGGFTIEKVLGSSSYYPGILDNAILRSGMIIGLRDFTGTDKFNAHVKIDNDHLISSIIPVLKGPEFGLLSGEHRRILLENEFIISNKHNRMGYQLLGTTVNIENDFTMLTDVTLPGTVQLTPAGNLIVLMRDCQTTGGYPRILQLTEQGINRLGQKKAKDIIRFKLKEITN